MSILKRQVNSSSDFPSFFSVITYSSSVNFKLIYFLLWANGSHENTNFDIFKCSDENLLNSSCHFWKHKSVFLQMLYQYSVPSNITPIYFFSSNIIYFVQKKPIKVLIFEIFEYSGQNLSNSSCQCWTDKSVPLQISHHLSLPWHTTLLQFLNSYIFNFRQSAIKYVIKVPIWRLLSALVKICQISQVNFWKHKPVFLQILYQSWVQLSINSSILF